MIYRSWLVASFVALSAFLWSDCTPTQPTPQPNGDITIINTQAQGGGGGTGPSGPGGPSGSCAAVATNRVGFFGIGCPSGVSPRNGQGVLPLGCVGFATSTPKSQTGTDVPASVHGPNIVWGLDTGGDRVRLVDVEEPFNKNVIPQSLGDVVVRATVTPPSCGPIAGTLAFQVTSATAASGGVVAMSAPAMGDELRFYREPDGRYMGTIRLGDQVPGVWQMDGAPPPPNGPPPAGPDGQPLPQGDPK